MKKLISFSVILSLVVMLLAGCGSKPETKPAASSAPASVPPATSSAAPAAGGAGVKVGLGHVVSIAGSKDFVAAKDGKPAVNGIGQVDAVMAAVTVDGSGKILSVKIDNAQTKVNFDDKGKLTSDLKALQLTKVELGKDYGLAKQSKIGKEWFEQIAELEKWMVGKTVAEVKAMKTVKRDDAHPNVPDVEDLKSKVTISVQDYIAAVEEAIKNAQPVSGTVAKSGLGHLVSIAGSKDFTPAKDGKPAADGIAQVDNVMALATFDANGKILSVKIDNGQTKVNFNDQGKVTSDLKVPMKTKVELGKDYGLAKQSKIQKEWFEQIAELEKWMVGKTVAEVKAMKTVKRDDAHPNVPDVEDLKSKVTISVQDYIAAVEEAYKTAK